MEVMSVLGIDLGGTKLASALFSADGSKLSEDAVPLKGRTGRDVGKLISGKVREYISRDAQIRAIGISVPGISRMKSGTVWAPNIEGWENYPLHEEIASVSGGLPVVIDSDRACCIMAEVWQGNARGCTDAIFLAVGTGIGAGILADGRILRGVNDIAGSVGWMAAENRFDKRYSSCGNFEYYASGNGIARFATELMQAYPGYGGRLKGAVEITTRDVFAAYDERDSLAVQVIEGCISYWGRCVSSLISIFNPQKIIFGGGIFGPAVKFIPSIREEALRWAQPLSGGMVIFEGSAMGTSAGVYGAGYIAMQSIQS